MTPEVGGFTLSLTVSVLSLVLSAYQARVVVDAMAERMNFPTLTEARSGDPDIPKHEINRHPKIPLALVSQAIDIAVSFPSGILTIFAYMTLDLLPDDASWVPMIIAVIWTLVCVWLARPAVAFIYGKWLTIAGVSVLACVLVIANVAGLVLAIGTT